MKSHTDQAKALFIRRLLVQTSLVLVAIMYLAPLFWMLDTSLKTEHQAMAQLPSNTAGAFAMLMVPHPLHPANYRKVISSPFFRRLRRMMVVMAHLPSASQRGGLR